jgi:coenzyme F420-reducing hydrogenase beta subunit
VRQWNQLIVRTENGRELVELAVKRGILELREAPSESLKELKDAAINKKKNALKNIIRKSGSVKKLLYLDSRDPAVLKYLTPEVYNRKNR